MSPGCNCCGAPATTCGTVTVTDRDQCAAALLPGAAVTLTLSAVTAVTLVSGGSGYTNGTNRTLTFTGGGGSGATGLCDVVGGAITNLRLTFGGSNYTSAPTVGFSGVGTGTGASATATIGTSTIGTCTSDGKVTAVTRSGAGGTGYTNGSYTNGTFTGGGGSGATFSYTVTSGIVANVITVTNGGTGYTSPPTPVFNAGPGTGAAATATVAASCAVPTTHTSAQTVTYRATVSKSGYTTNGGNATVAGCTDTPITVQLADWYGVVVTGCVNQALAGVTITANQAGTSLGTFTTDSTGWAGPIDVPLEVASNPITGSASHTRWASQALSGTQFVACRATGGTQTVNLTTPATGYTCFRSCGMPLALTLYLTDSIFGGTVTLTWTASTTLNGFPGWEGTQNVNFPGGGGCPAVPALPVRYTLLANTGGITTGFDLDVSWPAVSPTNTCPAGSATGSTEGSSFAVTSLTCPPAFSAVMTANLSTQPTLFQRVYGSSGTVTFTITE